MAKVRVLAIQRMEGFDMFINPLNFGGGLGVANNRWFLNEFVMIIVSYVGLLTGEMSPTTEWRQWLRLACKTTRGDALYRYILVFLT